MDKERERIATAVFLQPKPRANNGSLQLSSDHRLFERERYLRNGRRPDLTGRQKWALRESWSHFIAGDPGTTGHLVFTRMFANYHRTKERFEFLKDTDEVDHKSNNKYMFHVSRVMRFIGTVVDHVDHLEEVVPMLKQLGGRHGSKGYDIPAYYFTYFAEAMRQCMQSKLAEWTPLHESSWRELMDWVTVQVVQGQADYNGQRH